MATEDFVYLTVQEAVKFHVLYMRAVGETRFGIFNKSLIESALARPQQAAHYENVISLTLTLQEKEFFATDSLLSGIEIALK